MVFYMMIIFIAKLIMKRLAESEANIDKNHDKQVNKIGRQRAQSGLYSNFRDACNSYRVNGINDKY